MHISEHFLHFELLLFIDRALVCQYSLSLLLHVFWAFASLAMRRPHSIGTYFRQLFSLKFGQITYLAILLSMHVYGIRMVLVERHVNVALDPTGPHFIALLSVCCLMYFGSA
jgi:hypothetical protein